MPENTVRRSPPRSSVSLQQLVRALDGLGALDARNAQVELGEFVDADGLRPRACGRCRRSPERSRRADGYGARALAAGPSAAVSATGRRLDQGRDRGGIQPSRQRLIGLYPAAEQRRAMRSQSPNSTPRNCAGRLAPSAAAPASGNSSARETG